MEVFRASAVVVGPSQWDLVGREILYLYTEGRHVKGHEAGDKLSLKLGAKSSSNLDLGVPSFQNYDQLWHLNMLAAHHTVFAHIAA